MAQWYWMKGGQKQGPVDTVGLKRLAQSGQLLSTDMIWRDGLPNWVPASQANGLEFCASASGRAGGDVAVATAPVRAPAVQAPTAARGVIKYRCARCGGALESEGHFAGKQDTCPLCGKVTPVPTQSTTGAGASLKKVPKSVYIAVIVVLLLAVVSGALWLILRDTWERDNGSRIKSMATEVTALIQSGKHQEGVSRYDEMIALVGTRQIKDAELDKAISDAKMVAEPAKRKFLDEQRLADKRRKETEAVSKLGGLESQAKAFVDAGDFERGVEKYQQALDLIKDTQSDNPDLAAAVGRISQAKTFAGARLDQKRRDEEAERNRIEEEKRMASIKAHIKGGAWLTKKAGNSETLRGLKIFVVRSPATNQQLLAMLQAAMEGCKSRLAQAKDKLAFDEKWAREHPDNEMMQIDARSSKRIADLRQQLLTSVQDQMAAAAKVGGNVSVDMATIYALLSPTPTENETKVWAAICSQQLAGTVHTDVDGKYSIEVPGGYYFLYAMFESSYSEVEWFIPVKVGEAKDIPVDLHNENAVRITNKKD